MTTLRRALRSLAHSPAFALTVVLTLGIGVGLTDAIFTVVDAVLLRPLDYHDADRIVALESQLPQQAEPGNWIGGDDYMDLTRQVSGLSSTAYMYTFGETGLRVGGQADYVRVAGVSPGFGEVFGLAPVAGRLFDPRDAGASGALVSSAFAQSHFGSAAAALGRTIEAESMTRTIVGILPPGFGYPESTEVWMELPPQPANGSRTSGNQTAVGRRRTGVEAAALQAELALFSQRLGSSFPEDRGKNIEAVPLQDQIVGRVQPTLRLLAGSVLLVLLIVCTNITHMQLARATRRRRAAMVRTALGARKWSLAVDALTEGALLAVCGTLLAAALGWPALHALLRLAPADMPRLTEIHLDGRVLLLSLLLSLLLMALTALLPLLQLWGVDASSLLRGAETRGSDGRGARRLRSGLLIAEIAFTLVLCTTAVLLTRQLLAQSRVDFGFAVQQLLTLDIHLTGGPALPDEPAHPSPAEQAAYLARAIAIAEAWQVRVHTLAHALTVAPGVTSVAAIEGAPMGFGAVDVRYAVRGQQTFGSANAYALPVGYVHAVSPDLFRTMGMPLLRGRNLDAGDRLGTPAVVVISQTLARERFGAQNPLGKQIVCGYDWDQGGWTVVGVVADIRAEGPGAKPLPTMYVPLAQHPEKASDLQLLVRTPGDPSTLAPALLRRIGHDFPDVAVRASTMTGNIAAVQRLDQLRTVVFAGFGAVSLLLAAVGIYGITAYSVAQRRFEFGLRLAVGASRHQLLALVMGGTVRLALAGVLLGLLASVVAFRVLGAVLGSWPPFDLSTCLLSVSIVLALAAMAAWLPARMASQTEPMQVLRSE